MARHLTYHLGGFMCINVRIDVSSAYAPLKCVKTYMIEILLHIHEGGAVTRRFVVLKWFLPYISRKRCILEDFCPGEICLRLILSSQLSIGEAFEVGNG